MSVGRLRLRLGILALENPLCLELLPLGPLLELVLQLILELGLTELLLLRL